MAWTQHVALTKSPKCPFVADPAIVSSSFLVVLFYMSRVFVISTPIENTP